MPTTQGGAALSPLVIVGIGGSGTRVFARLAETSGRHMGSVQNESSDALPFFEFANRWCGHVHETWGSGRPVADKEVRFESELAECVAKHRHGADASKAWGWKQPRSIHLLPALEAAYRDDLLVLHVMRDGRDIALGKKIHLHLTKSYTVPAELTDEPESVQLAYIWATANVMAADFGEQRLRERYLRVSLEELCCSPDSVATKIVALIGGDISRQAVREVVRRPPSIGRWRHADPHLTGRILEISQEALRRFGYPT